MCARACVVRARVNGGEVTGGERTETRGGHTERMSKSNVYYGTNLSKLSSLTLTVTLTLTSTVTLIRTVTTYNPNIILQHASSAFIAQCRHQAPAQCRLNLNPSQHPNRNGSHATPALHANRNFSVNPKHKVAFTTYSVRRNEATLTIP